MYQPLSNKLIHEDDGTNSPLDHQRVISKLTVELGVLFYHQKAITLEPLPETPLSEGSGYPMPDILLFDPATEQTRVIIEVCNNRSFASDIRKVIRLIEDDDYGIQEGLVYNYRALEWRHYRLGEGGVAIEPTETVLCRSGGDPKLLNVLLRVFADGHDVEL